MPVDLDELRTRAQAVLDAPDGVSLFKARMALFGEDFVANVLAMISRTEGAEAVAEGLNTSLRQANKAATDAEISLAALKAENERLRKAGRDLLQYVDDQTCTHESVHRGGTIWTICDECGKEWADDKGGFQPHEDAPAVAAFRTALEATNG